MIGPAVIVVLGLVSVFRGKNADSKFGVMTPERNHLYQSALKSKVLSPTQLEKLATAFEEQGLKAEGSLLRKRAKLRSMSPDEKEARKDVFRRALKSKDPNAVERVANIYEAQGATGSAKTLRMVAIGLRNARDVSPVNVTPEPETEVMPSNATTDNVVNNATPVDSSVKEPLDISSAVKAAETVAEVASIL